MVTFKNWRLNDAIRETQADRLLLETDGPYLAPVPYRGKRNEPAYVREIAKHVATIRDVSLDGLIAQTGDNARRVFGLEER
jgi:TatD DNase family protein